MARYDPETIKRWADDADTRAAHSTREQDARIYRTIARSWLRIANYTWQMGTLDRLFTWPYFLAPSPHVIPRDTMTRAEVQKMIRDIRAHRSECLQRIHALEAKLQP